MNTNQHRSTTFKWQGFLSALLAFASLFETATMPLPSVVAATALSKDKAGPLTMVEGLEGIGGDGSSRLLFEQLEVPREEDGIWDMNCNNMVSTSLMGNKE